jgi:hypothetical protein
MKDGTVRRRPSDQCEHLLETGKAKRYISNTIYRAVSLGIEVKDFGDRDEKGALKKRIRAASVKAKSRREKQKQEASD